MYQYRAIIQKVIDGDTMEVNIDLGLTIWVQKEKIRLFGVDTPEVYGIKKGSVEWELGNKSSEFVKSIANEKPEIIIETIKDQKEKFGRYLGIVYVQINPDELVGLSDVRNLGDYFCLNDILIQKGLAKKYME